jgi:hypothetical protein
MFRRHRLHFEYADGEGRFVDTPGIRYWCSCGRSKGWISGTDKRKVRKMNRLAHKVMKKR